MSNPRNKGGTLDVVRLDILLWALGGFAEVDESVPFGSWAYPDSLWREIDALAAKPKTPHGELEQLSARSGRPYGSLRVYVHHARHGRRPQYHKHMAATGRPAA